METRWRDSGGLKLVLSGQHSSSSHLVYHSASALESEGATLTDADVERDGFIITGNGPGASQEFGETIATAVDE